MANCTVRPKFLTVRGIDKGKKPSSTIFIKKIKINKYWHLQIKTRNHAFVCTGSVMQIFVSNQAIEGDCDVVLDKIAGVLTVSAFKCKTEGNFPKLLCNMSTNTVMLLCLNLATSPFEIL